MNTKELKQALKDEIRKIESSPDIIMCAELLKQKKDLEVKINKINEKTWKKETQLNALRHALYKLE